MGHPQWYVSHAWQGSFVDLVAGLQQELAPEPGPAEPALPKGLKDGIFLWIGKHHTGNYIHACTLQLMM